MASCALLYLHGFRSSPLSTKACLIERRMSAAGRASDYDCPPLPVSPAAAAILIEEHARVLLERAGNLAIMGSSLGGFYATWLAERPAFRSCRVVVLNPANTPQIGLAAYVGEHSVYHSDERIVFKREYLDELARLAVEHISRPERYLLVAAKGDELLDWRDMVAHYPGAHHRVLPGSDHGLSDFPEYMDEVLEFALGEALP